MDRLGKGPRRKAEDPIRQVIPAVLIMDLNGLLRHENPGEKT
jgi:hypothetical protein